MSFIHSKSEEIEKPELDLFSLPGTQTSVERSYWDAYHPTTTITEGAPITFHASGSGNAFMDLLLSSIFFELEILRKDGKPWATTGEDVGLTNNFLHSFIREV